MYSPRSETCPQVLCCCPPPPTTSQSALEHVLHRRALPGVPPSIGHARCLSLSGSSCLCVCVFSFQAENLRANMREQTRIWTNHVQHARVWTIVFASMLALELASGSEHRSRGALRSVREARTQACGRTRGQKKPRRSECERSRVCSIDDPHSLGRPLAKPLAELLNIDAYHRTHPDHSTPDSDTETPSADSRTHPDHSTPHRSAPQLRTSCSTAQCATACRAALYRITAQCSTLISLRGRLAKPARDGIALLGGPPD